jgi:hypothetical protein
MEERNVSIEQRKIQFWKNLLNTENTHFEMTLDYPRTNLVPVSATVGVDIEKELAGAIDDFAVVSLLSLSL